MTNALTVNTTKTEDGKNNVYTFTSRGTEYTVISGYGFDHDEFAVWSNRLNHSSRTPPAVMNLKEMTKRSKVLGHLSALLAA
mgnify:FL=1|jgi:hypothetical protein